MLKLENITKDYVVGKNVTHALKGIDIEFRPNEFVAILGPSGCGKTTLLNIMGGLDRYTDGDMYVNGRSTKAYEDYDWDKYRNQTIGFIFQSYNLIGHQTILSNVELALTLIGVGREERRRRAIEALTSVGLEDQIYKKPNQLSGGQMQRVAIARAIINNPKVLLADEPTGALDSESSVQVMNILKELSKDRLVVMVTHNDELAHEYADRIVNVKDGVVTSDTNPYVSDIPLQEVKTKEKNVIKRIKNFFKHDKAEKHTSMKYGSAIRLSANNLSTKKMRTTLTSFAGSIGIIGIAIVLSLSSGFSAWIKDTEEKSLSAYPLIVGAESGISLEDAMSLIAEQSKQDEATNLYPSEEEAYVNDYFSHIGELLGMTSIGTQTDLTAFKSYMEEHWDYSWGYYKNVYGFEKHLYSDYTSPGEYTQLYPFDSLIPEELSSFKGMVSNLAVMDELPNDELLHSQYELVGSKSRWPQTENELVIILDNQNRITDFMLFTLGLVDRNSLQSLGDLNNLFKDSYSFDELLSLTYKITPSSNLYTSRPNGSYYKEIELTTEQLLATETVDLKVVGIIRPRADAKNACLNGVIGYTSKLTEKLISMVYNSDVVKAQQANPSYDVLKNKEFTGNADEKREAYEANLKTMGCCDINSPDQILLYPNSFESKEAMIAMIEEYNNQNVRKMVPYADNLASMMSFINRMSDTVTYVLVGFSAISLVVSSIMIGIITYISVLERTKEIGILRSIGARKRDISRVFNAETFMIGLISGIIGVVFTCIMYFPINAILNSLVGINNLFQLVWWQLLALVGVSVGLTLISGFIPARMAANKDPVIALRSE